MEPFSGAAAFSLTLAPEKALLNDINPHLINLFREVQKKDFSLSLPLTNERDYYHQLRQDFNSCVLSGDITGRRVAEIFWLLNRLGFNGLCRFNQQGLFNTPFGRYQRIYADFDWAQYALLLEKWSFTNSCYSSVAIEENDFIFCDPPYDISWQGYYQNTFPFEKQKELALWLATQQAPAIIMNHATDRIVALYESLNFEINYISAPRTLAAQATSRKKCLEVIATHNFSWKDALKKV